MNAIVESAGAEPVVLQPAAQVANVVTPYRLLQVAVERGADLAYVEKLMGLVERTEANEARKAFVDAMTAFKAEPLEIFKRKLVSFETRDGDTTSYKHAELSDVGEVVVPALARHGFSHRWDVQQGDGRIVVTCHVTHRLGHSESVRMDAAPDNSGKKNAIQQMASAVTYLQRYTLLAITGLATKDQNDDGRGSGDIGGGGGSGESGKRGGGDPERAPGWPAEMFAKQIGRWRKAIAVQIKTADDIVAMARSKGQLSPEQEAAVRAPITEQEQFVAEMEQADQQKKGARA